MNPNSVTNGNPIAEGQSVVVPSANTDTSIASTSPNTEVVTTTNEVTSVQTPTSSATTTTTTVVQPKKKSSCLLWFCSCGAILLLLLVACICSVGIWLPQYIKSTTVTGGFNKSDYAHISSSEINTSDKTVENKIEEAQELTNGEAYSVTLTEKEVLNYILSQSADSKSLADGVYLNFENNNKASIRIELSSILKNSDNQNINPDDFKDIFIGVDFTIASDGKSLTVDKVTSGNQFVDSLVAEGIKEGMQESVDEALAKLNSEDNPNAAYVLDAIKITDGQMTISYDPK